jgi:hypothetical protein
LWLILLLHFLYAVVAVGAGVVAAGWSELGGSRRAVVVSVRSRRVPVPIDAITFPVSFPVSFPVTISLAVSVTFAVSLSLSVLVPILLPVAVSVFPVRLGAMALLADAVVDVGVLIS